jgi:hypothetical protein
MQKSKLHHSVPVHYLERFTGEDGLLWVYPTDGTEPRAIHPRKTAVERYLYAPEVGDDPAENRFQSNRERIEKRMSSAGDPTPNPFRTDRNWP